MIEIYRTFDTNFIARCYQMVWHEIADDQAADQKLFFPDISLNNYWLIAENDKCKLGLFLARKMNEVCYETHIISLPLEDDHAPKVALRAIEWMFEHETKCERLIGCIPTCNKRAIAIAKKAGMKKFGVNKNSFMKNGKLFDQVYLGISRG